jgi:hypothetical protein
MQRDIPNDPYMSQQCNFVLMTCRRMRSAARYIHVINNNRTCSHFPSTNETSNQERNKQLPVRLGRHKLPNPFSRDTPTARNI